MKYVLTKNKTTTSDGRILRQIQAVKDFEIDDVEIAAGAFGGYVEKESNLSQAGDCWIFPGAKVWGDARVSDSAVVKGVAQVSGRTRVIDNASVWGTICPGDATLGHYAKTFKGVVSGGYFFGASIIGAPDAEIIVNDSSDVVFISGLGASIIDATFFKTNCGVYINCRIDIGVAENVIARIEKFDAETAEVLKAVGKLLK